MATVVMNRIVSQTYVPGAPRTYIHTLWKPRSKRMTRFTHARSVPYVIDIPGGPTASRAKSRNSPREPENSRRPDPERLESHGVRGAAAASLAA